MSPAGGVTSTGWLWAEISLQLGLSALVILRM